MSSLSQNPLGYTGVLAKNPPDVIRSNRAPGAVDKHHPIGTLWENTITRVSYQLVSVVGGTAVWNTLGGSAAFVSTLTGNTGGAILPAANNITLAGGTGVETTGAGNTITLSEKLNGFAWTTTAGGATALVAQNAYIVGQDAGLTTFTLPAVAVKGATYKIVGFSTNGWQVTQGAGQTIHIPGDDSTTGVAGTLDSADPADCVELTCIIANTDFTVTAVSGAPTVT